MQTLLQLIRNRYTILFLAWLGWVFDIADTALFTFAKGPMLIQMLGSEGYRRIGPSLEARIQAGFLLGWAVGGLIFGVLADRWGRTRTLVITVLLYCLFTGLTALCKSPDQVLFARFITGLGIGGEWAAGATLVAECFSDQQRPLAASLLQTAAAFGPIFAAIANWLIVGYGWQWLFVIGVAPAMLVVLARFSAHDPKPIVVKSSPLGDLFAHSIYRKRAIAAMFVGAVGIAGAGTATYWQPNLVRAVSIGMSPALIAARTSSVSIVSQIGTLAGVFIGPMLSRRFGRKRTIALFFLATPFVVIVAIAGAGNYGRLLMLLPFVNLFAIGVSGVFVLYFPEMFPFAFRATGAGLAYNVGRVLAIPVPFFTGWATARFGGSIASGVVASGSIYLIGLVALPFLPETMHSTLDES